MLPPSRATIPGTESIRGGIDGTPMGNVTLCDNTANLLQ
jgi:hypothetical protein